ncbi:MAG TPA: hypothetical protein VFH27_17490 [Longimicrobiaceae bacterium]|nr:hypothetical protein [Longimicrobiaceae bacterium]
MRSRSIAVALALASASLARAAAQTSPSTAHDPPAVAAQRTAATDSPAPYRIAAGTLVRIELRDRRRPRVTGRVTAADSGGVTVLAAGDSQPERIARADIARFEVAVPGRSAASRAARGARDGLLLGGLVSTVAIGAMCVRRNACGDDGTAFAIVFLGVPVTGGSALIGLVAGVNGSGQRWVPAPVPTAISESSAPIVDGEHGAWMPRWRPPVAPRRAPGLRIRPPGSPIGLLRSAEEDGLTALVTISLIRNPGGAILPPRSPATAVLTENSGPLATPAPVATALSSTCSSAAFC